MDKQDLIKITANINKESCPGLVNFHCHTKFSDGSFDPEQLLDQAFINKIKFVMADIGRGGKPPGCGWVY